MVLNAELVLTQGTADNTEAVLAVMFDECWKLWYLVITCLHVPISGKIVSLLEKKRVILFGQNS